MKKPVEDQRERCLRLHKRMQTAATELNQITDELAGAVLLWNDFMRNLNLGITAWLEVHASENGNRSIGYTKIGKKWCIAIRQREGEEITTWEFAQAPRWMRVEMAGKVIDLLETLAVRAEQMTAMCKNRTEQVYEHLALMEKAGRAE